MSDWPPLGETADGVTFEVRVAPNAPRCRLVRDGERLKARIDAAPVDGEANERLIRYLAKEVFRVARADVRIVAGERGRTKVIAVRLTVERAREALIEALERG